MNDSPPSVPSVLNLGPALDDRYTVEKELGRGAMGHVYLARDQKL
jgi:serine/threonine protein kinase